MHSLPIFTNANLLLQREDPVLHLLQERLHEVATDILVSFIKPSAITSCENIYEIEHHRRSRQKERDEVSIGEATRRYLDAQKGTSLTNTAVAEFFEDVRFFYSSSLKYIFEKLPMNQEELEKAAVMDVSKRATAKFAHVRFWLSRFSCLKSGIDKVEELEKEFFKYQVDKLEGINPSERLDAVWGKIGDLKDSSGSVRYPLLTKFMKGLLAIPHSNADAERVFSLVRKNKTETRSSMSRQLLSDIIVQKMHMLSRDKVCHSLELSRAVLTKAK